MSSAIEGTVLASYDCMFLKMDGHALTEEEATEAWCNYSDLGRHGEMIFNGGPNNLETCIKF